MPDTVSLHFFGKIYDLRADDSSDDVEEVVRYVERVMAETEQRHRGLSPQKMMVLAALHMGRDYIREKKRSQDLASRMKKTSSRIADRIDTVLEERDGHN
jgi:cell division protein ZapA (FtsZ GTPase activity inhibitor)